ncbi:Gfo/Idh/MocA family oxidoreductase [Sulfobacillus harzensis]|uniref:Gfo/Idh/MocA family protein n=1 Tax=Sulfobacillus harzensis TaxID=2729629 RepID=UPI003083FD43
MRAALVGCGKIGQKHLQAMVHTQVVDLAATVDLDLERAAAAAVPFDAAPFTSLSEMCRAFPDVEAVVIATPSGTHRQLVEEAMGHNLHVLVEKPIALSALDADHMVNLAAQRGRVLAVSHFYRLLPTVSMALAAFHEGKLGRLVEASLSVRWSLPQSYYDAAPWRGTQAVDGGVLYNQAVHGLDTLLEFTGPILEVFGYAATLTHDIEVDDTFVGVMRAANGALVTVNATTSVAEGNLEERLAVVGSEGSLILGPSIQQVDFWRVAEDDEEAVKSEVGQMPLRSGWKSHADALLDFTQAILEGRKPRLSGQGALHVMEVIDALLRSSQTGQPVTLQRR